MRSSITAPLVLILLVSCSKPKEETPTRGHLEVAVTSSHQSLFEAEAQEFGRLYPEATVSILARSTREAIVALLNDSVSLICIDRPMNEEEKSVVQRAEIDVVETIIAEDALAIIVHSSNPIERISQTSFREIFSGNAKSWTTVPEAKWSGPIDVVLTDRNSGLYELLVERFLHTAQSTLAVSHFAQSSDLVFHYVSTHPKSIGVVSLLALQDSAATVKVLAVESPDTAAPERFVKLHQANIYRKFYPLHYSLYVYSTAPKNSVAAGFTAFVASAPGQKIILNAGLVPATMPVRLVQFTED